MLIKKKHTCISPVENLQPYKHWEAHALPNRNLDPWLWSGVGVDLEVISELFHSRDSFSSCQVTRLEGKTSTCQVTHLEGKTSTCQVTHLEG